jgi:hypothetical protein
MKTSIKNKRSGLIYKFILIPSKLSEFSILACRIFINGDSRDILLQPVYTSDWKPQISRIKPNGYNARDINNFIRFTIFQINEVLNYLIDSKQEITTENFYCDFFNTKFEAIGTQRNEPEPQYLTLKAQ